MPELTASFLQSNTDADLPGKFIVTKDNKIFIEPGLGYIRHSDVAKRNHVRDEDIVDAGTFFLSQNTLQVSGGSIDFSINEENSHRSETENSVEAIAEQAGFSFMRKNPRN